MKWLAPMVLALQLCVSYAYALPPDKKGEKWMGPGFELEYHYMLDANDVNHGRKGWLRCTVGKSQAVNEDDIESLASIVKAYGDSVSWNHIQGHPPEFYRQFAAAPDNQIITFYQEPRLAAKSSMVYDYSQSPETLQKLVATVEALCMREVKD